MNTTPIQTTDKKRRTGARLIIVAATAAITLSAGSVAAGPTNPPPWSQCVYAHLPVAASLGGLLPVDYDPPAATKAALLGEIAAGTDCSIYDLPV